MEREAVEEQWWQEEAGPGEEGKPGLERPVPARGTVASVSKLCDTSITAAPLFTLLGYDGLRLSKHPNQFQPKTQSAPLCRA